MIKAAIIGLGDISFVHLDAILDNPEIQLVAACDLNEELKSRVPEGTAFYTDYKKMVEETKPDVVHNCLPHYLHFPVTKDLVEMGCNVFCEKPIAMNTAQAAEFEAFEAAHPEVKIGVCLQNRMNETTEALKQIIDSGEYGIVLRAKGIVAGADGQWIHFDFVPGEADVRFGSADVMGRLCVIGSKLDEAAITKLFDL